MNKPLFRDSDAWFSVNSPVTDEEVALWVKALRSDTFEQGTGELRNSEGFCCLGVLAHELDLFDTLDIKHTAGDISVFGSSFPGRIAVKGYHKLPATIQGKLADLNDNGMSFAKIADIIEAGFKEYEGNAIPEILANNGFDEEWAASNNFATHLFYVDAQLSTEEID